jgi:hypothetical protein
VIGLDPVWQSFNQEFYQKNGLVHKLIDGKYEINFKVTGFDRDPYTSLIIEATKKTYVNKIDANEIYNNSPNNYNRYASSLLTSSEFVSRLDDLAISYPPEKL